MFLAEAEGTCSGDICRLDLNFIDGINELAYLWQENFHANNGFDRVATCADNSRKIAGPGSDPGAEKTGKQGVKTSNAQCCGRGLERQLFHTNRMECCEDGKPREIGTC